MLSEAQNIDLHPVADASRVVEQVPVIDIGELIRDSESVAARPAIEQIAEACRTWGFFQIVNHGVTEDLIERTWSTSLASRVKLGISQGMHSGFFDLHLVDAGWQELFVVGPGMTATVDCEGNAERGEILLSASSAALIAA